MLMFILASGHVWSEKLEMGPAWKLGYPKVCDHHHGYYGEHYSSQAGQASVSIIAGSLCIFNFQHIFDTLYQMTQTAANGIECMHNWNVDSKIAQAY